MNVIQNIPGIWEYLYDNPKVVSRINIFKNIAHKINGPKLKKLIDSVKPDVIACTQAYPCGMVADYKAAYGINIPLVAVLTDYVPHSFWLYDSVNYYVVPSEEVAIRLKNKGVESQKIKVFGIPFDPKFNLPVDKSAVCKKLNFDPDLPTVMIMGGGHGLGPIKEVIDRLERVSQKIQEIIVCGSNKKLYDSLLEIINNYHKKNILLGFTDQISELMSISDILITKPGGITTAEALAKNLPMIIVKPIPGQEANNADYLTSAGAAIRLNTLDDLTGIIEGLLKDKHKLEGLRNAAGRISKPQSSLDIAKLLLEI
jgi:processive 1,2-diacylglycerol beta-glucosyltransferase